MLELPITAGPVYDHIVRKMREWVSWVELSGPAGIWKCLPVQVLTNAADYLGLNGYWWTLWAVLLSYLKSHFTWQIISKSVSQ